MTHSIALEYKEYFRGGMVQKGVGVNNKPIGNEKVKG